METKILTQENSAPNVQSLPEHDPDQCHCGQSLTLMVDATNQCQLSCEYCYFGDKSCKILNPDLLHKAIINFITAIDNGVKHINIHYMGGEPLLGWKQILTLNHSFAEYAAKKKIAFAWSLTSNLVALNEEKKELMIKERANIHCSIDGPQFIQDKNRPLKNGKGSFLRVDRNIELALQITPDDVARVTVTPFSSYYLPEITTYLLDKGFKQVGLFPAYNMTWEASDYNAWGEGLKKSFEIAKQKNGKISTIVSARNLQKTNTFSYCGAGKGLWSFDVNGNLYHCHHFSNKSEYVICNAASATPDEIKESIKLKNLTPQTIELPEKCRDCPVANNCNGGCWSDNLMNSGNQYLPDSVSCTFQKITYENIKEFIDPVDDLGYKMYCTKCERNADGPHPNCYMRCDNSCQRCERKCQNCDRGECWSCENTCMTHHDHY